MTDHEFDELLSDSIRTYGHEYESEVLSSDVSAPPHAFPPKFLDDIPLTKTKRSKVIRIIRYSGIAAAVLVLGIAVILAPLLSGQQKTLQSEMTATTSSADHSIKNLLPNAADAVQESDGTVNYGQTSSGGNAAADESTANHADENQEILPAEEAPLSESPTLPDTFDDQQKGDQKRQTDSAETPQYTVTAFVNNQVQSLSAEEQLSCYRYAESILVSGTLLTEDPTPQQLEEIRTAGKYYVITFPEPTQLQGYYFTKITLAVSSDLAYGLYDGSASPDGSVPVHLAFISEDFPSDQ